MSKGLISSDYMSIYIYIYIYTKCLNPFLETIVGDKWSFKEE